MRMYALVFRPNLSLEREVEATMGGGKWEGQKYKNNC